MNSNYTKLSSVRVSGVGMSIEHGAIIHDSVTIRVAHGIWNEKVYLLCDLLNRRG